MTIGEKKITEWFQSRSWSPFDWQKEVWKTCLNGNNGLLNAPTGSGKTFALLLPALIEWINNHPDSYQKKVNNGLQILWITPLRALARDLEKAMSGAVQELGIPWDVQRRTGDVSSSIKQKQKKQMPEILITTPESLHVLLAQKGYPKRFKNLKRVIVDEWHELMGSKRGTQTELGLSRLSALCPGMQVWGISATIGNLEEAADVIAFMSPNPNEFKLIKAPQEKKISVRTVLPDQIETFPWSGHLGTNLLHKILPILDKNGSTIIFTNTRAQSELWFQQLLEAEPELAGRIALHHGSLSREIRDWVEHSLHTGDINVVVCTSSLDLGVDFSPVDTVIQVGSPKGISRFIQRAGRSGHQPGAESKIWFVPTHSLELIEASALREAVHNKQLETRYPLLKPFDVLIQYIITLSVSEGFTPSILFKEIKNTFSYQTLNVKEWNWILTFIQSGGYSLSKYDEYSKVFIDEDEVWRVSNQRIARRHRMSIGTISGDSMLRVKFLKGGSLGRVEEWFISQLNLGDHFWFAGRNLELVKIKDMTAFVRKAKSKNGKIPSYLGGRMSLSSNMSSLLRKKLQEATTGHDNSIEIQTLKPLFDIQAHKSCLPQENQLLIEKSWSKEGCHCFFFPFEGRYVHEGMAALIAYRLARLKPATFSIAMNDYGFELLSDQDIPIEEALEKQLFSATDLIKDLKKSVNNAELAKRRFRGISQIAGLTFSGFPGNRKQSRHLQMSSGIFFDVFTEYEPGHLLIQQAYDEVLERQLDVTRLHQTIERINNQQIVLRHTARFSPFAFPIYVDRLRERISSETLVERILKIQKQLKKDAES